MILLCLLLNKNHNNTISTPWTKPVDTSPNLKKKHSSFLPFQAGLHSHAIPIINPINSTNHLSDHEHPKKISHLQKIIIKYLIIYATSHIYHHSKKDQSNLKIILNYPTDKISGISIPVEIKRTIKPIKRTSLIKNQKGPIKIKIDSLEN